MGPRLFRPGHRAAAIGLAAAVASVVCSAERVHDPSQSPALLKDVLEVIPGFATLPGVPGFAATAVRGTDVLFEHAYGLSDIETGERLTPKSLFYVASTTKSFTAMAAAVLEHRGQLDFNQTLAAALPDVRLQPPMSPASITIRDLLTMSHGIGGGGPVDFRTAYSGEFTNAGLIRLLASHPPSAAGRNFEYGNLGYNVLGLVLDARFPEGWKEVLRREVFEPLGMRDTTGRRSTADPRRLAMPHRRTASGTTRVPMKKQDENMHAAGGHFTTVGDLARYLEAHLDAGRVDGRQALRREAVEATHRQTIAQDRRVGSMLRTGWGLGWDIGTYEGERILARPGGFPGHTSILAFLPERRIGVAVLANGDSYAAADAVMACLFDALLGDTRARARCEARLRSVRDLIASAQRQMAPPASRSAARPPRPLSAYAGTYVNPEYGTFVMRAQSGRLDARFGVLESEAVFEEGGVFRVDLDAVGPVRFTFVEGSPVASALTYRTWTFRRIQ